MKELSKTEDGEKEGELSFLPGKSYLEAEKFFQLKRKDSFFSFFKSSPEKIKSIERRAKPLGLFLVKKGKGEEFYKKRIFVDLSAGEIYSIEGSYLKKDPLLRKVLELPSEIQEDLLHLMEHKNLEIADFSKKHLAILEKKGLISTPGKRKKSFLVSLSDHLLTFIISFINALGELINLKPTERPASSKEDTSKAYININYLKLDRSYDLNFYLESDNLTNIPQQFHSDEIKYSPQKIEAVLPALLSSEAEVKFEKVIYLPYYQCHYENLNERELSFFPLKFKSFTSHFREIEYRDLYLFIDKAPEVPFLFLASLYAAYLYPNLKEIVFVFSNSFIFIFLALFIGFSLKIIFKKEREVPYFTSSPMRYGFPSLHSLTSLGAITFVFFLPKLGPYLSLALLPLGFLYVYSRLKLKVHSLRDVLGGGIIGIILGSIYGYFFLSFKPLSLPFLLELILALLFFTLPLFSILYRVKINYLP